MAAGSFVPGNSLIIQKCRICSGPAGRQLQNKYELQKKKKNAFTYSAIYQYGVNMKMATKTTAQTHRGHKGAGAIRLGCLFGLHRDGDGVGNEDWVGNG